MFFPGNCTNDWSPLVLVSLNILKLKIAVDLLVKASDPVMFQNIIHYLGFDSEQWPFVEASGKLFTSHCLSLYSSSVATFAVWKYKENIISRLCFDFVRRLRWKWNVPSVMFAEYVCGLLSFYYFFLCVWWLYLHIYNPLPVFYLVMI